MNVILASVGTDGDIFPYVGLGVELGKRGHAVTLVASEHYSPLSKRHGLNFRALHSEAYNHELFSHPNFWHPIKAGPVAAAWGLRRIEAHYRLLAELCGQKHTILVANPGLLSGILIHEKHGNPWATLLLQPWMIASVDAPPVMLGLPVPRKAPAAIIRLYWRFIDIASDLLIARQFNSLRASLHLPPIRRVLRRWFSPQLVIGGFPAWYAKPQPDWPKQLKMAGFPMFDGATSAELSPELVKFCQADSAPIALTFGTEMMHGKHLFREAIEACGVLGKRAIVLTKYKEQLPDPLPGNVLHCSFAPFRKLFPLCAAVVHHGGIGTTSQALAAGIPQLILPLAFDQGDNAERVQRLAAGDWVASKRATATNIARALSGLLTPAMRENAATISREFSSGSGLTKAADYVEELADRPVQKSAS